MSPSDGRTVPSDIIEAILFLLPPKSLGRFKCVSKTWNSIISNPQFIKTHLHQNPHPSILVSYANPLYTIDTNQLLRDDETPKKLTFQPPSIWWTDFMGSCNGIVSAKDDVNGTVFFTNPTTHEIWKLPHSPFQHPDEDEKEIAVRYGFGYDSVTDDYKLVSVSFVDPEREPYFEDTDTLVSVYSLRNNAWKKLSDSVYDHAAFGLSSGALVNERFHWLVGSSTIVAFSFASEEFDEIKLPDSFEHDAVGFYDLVELGGKLGVSWGIAGVYELWVMEEYGNAKSWARLFPHEFEDPVRLVCLVAGSDRDVVLVVDDDGEIVVYNIDEGRRRDLRIVGGPTGFYAGCTYGESIESLKRIRTAS